MSLTNNERGEADGRFTVVLLILILLRSCSADDQLRAIRHQLETGNAKIEVAP